MSAKFAIVRAPTITKGALSTIFINPFIWLWHKIFYEQIAGYSLGRPVDFFDTLRDAKERVEFLASANQSVRRQKLAIVEFERDNQKINFNRLYEFNDRSVTWPHRLIANHDLTRGAPVVFSGLHVAYMVKLTSNSNKVDATNQKSPGMALATPAKTVIFMRLSQSQSPSGSDSPRDPSSSDRSLRSLSSTSSNSLDFSQSFSPREKRSQPRRKVRDKGCY